jgi:hypothetical protein
MRLESFFCEFCLAEVQLHSFLSKSKINIEGESEIGSSFLDSYESATVDVMRLHTISLEVGQSPSETWSHPTSRYIKVGCSDSRFQSPDTTSNHDDSN